MESAVWDVVRKPSIRPKKLVAKEHRAAVSLEEYCGQKLSADTVETLHNTERETNEMYEVRLAHDCTKERPHHYFQRQPVPRLDAELIELVKLIEPDEVDDASPLKNLGMMMNNRGFKNTVLHDPIDGLGSQELFDKMITPELRETVKDGKTVLDALMFCHDDETLEYFERAGKKAIEEMFDLMEKGQHGVGIFHDPTIPFTAIHFGLLDARSLKSMEAIIFRLYDNGSIVASWE